MPEKKIFPLSKLAEAIEKVVSTHCSKSVWVKAEIVKLNFYKHTGHCYPDLVEKKDGRIIAELRGTIWKSNLDLINEKFREVLGEDLKDDMTVVAQAAVNFHPVYGLALNITDIDPAFTLGELAKQKAEAIRRLKKEEIFGANRRTFLPPLPKTIAVISVSSSKGYQDFMNVLENNEWGYKYHTLLFPAILQGERAVTTIRAQLEHIQRNADIFDAVAIIRGGGGEIGLSCYDSYLLAKAIAEFPIPVLTGIGHSTNETVSELVSFKSFITPTKIAEFLLQEFHNFSQPLKENKQRVKMLAEQLMERQEAYIRETGRSFGFLAGRILDKSGNRLEHFRTALLAGSKSLLMNEKAELRNLNNSIDLLSPENILRRGYSITRSNGNAVRDTEELKVGDRLETTFYKGKTISIVKNTHSKEDN